MDVVEINVATGEEIRRSLTGKEQAERVKDAAAVTERMQREQSDETKRTQARQTIKAAAANDPNLAALATLLGIE